MNFCRCSHTNSRVVLVARGTVPKKTAAHDKAQGDACAVFRKLQDTLQATRCGLAQRLQEQGALKRGLAGIPGLAPGQRPSGAKPCAQTILADLQALFCCLDRARASASQGTVAENSQVSGPAYHQSEDLAQRMESARNVNPGQSDYPVPCEVPAPYEDPATNEVPASCEVPAQSMDTACNEVPAQRMDTVQSLYPAPCEVPAPYEDLATNEVPASCEVPAQSVDTACDEVPAQRMDTVQSLYPAACEVPAPYEDLATNEVPASCEVPAQSVNTACDEVPAQRMDTVQSLYPAPCEVPAPYEDPATNEVPAPCEVPALSGGPDDVAPYSTKEEMRRAFQIALKQLDCVEQRIAKVRCDVAYSKLLLGSAPRCQLPQPPQLPQLPQSSQLPQLPQVRPSPPSQPPPQTSFSFTAYETTSCEVEITRKKRA
ncbi:fibrous sheath CABYR-binding protein-like [Bacillus rossius redtenbacheri]|uniref:fibrous sheath CABYR-binding protein-like n=1 Tax=Bacillus rossius redtenbacheri TaxID=93214 RepID=UPI002FDD1BF1